ncbi:hypothetical protein BKA57DRAFT_437283 [Linnemannia elongata]|nr:hypothetical protein BKA57DRAFT_437283 [Linnemannia elongata]
MTEKRKGGRRESWEGIVDRGSSRRPVEGVGESKAPARFVEIPELSIIASNQDPIEFSGVAPEKEEGDAQEKRLEVVDESQISGAEDKAELEDADEDEKKEV